MCERYTRYCRRNALYATYRLQPLITPPSLPQAQAPDDLSVRRGDWVYADLSNQTVDGWLWSYSPKNKKYGFIPRAYARPPAMTSL